MIQRRKSERCRITAEDRGGDELTQGERCEQQPDGERRRAERLGIKRQQRDDDPEPDEVHEQRDDNDVEGTGQGMLCDLAD